MIRTERTTRQRDLDPGIVHAHDLRGMADDGQAHAGQNLYAAVAWKLRGRSGSTMVLPNSSVKFARK